MSMEKENLEKITEKPQEEEFEIPQIEKELSPETVENIKHENGKYREFLENYRNFLKNIFEYEPIALEKISEVKKAKYLRFVNLAQYHKILNDGFNEPTEVHLRGTEKYSIGSMLFKDLESIERGKDKYARSNFPGFDYNLYLADFVDYWKNLATRLTDWFGSDQLSYYFELEDSFSSFREAGFNKEKRKLLRNAILGVFPSKLEHGGKGKDRELLGKISYLFEKAFLSTFIGWGPESELWTKYIKLLNEYDKTNKLNDEIKECELSIKKFILSSGLIMKERDLDYLLSFLKNPEKPYNFKKMVDIITSPRAYEIALLMDDSEESRVCIGRAVEDTKFFESYEEMIFNRKPYDAWSCLYGKPKILGSIVIKSEIKREGFLFKRVLREMGAAAIKDPRTTHPIFNYKGKVYWPVTKSDIR